jgi:hypothetical protein
VRQGLAEGGLGIGFPNAYVPGAGAKEISTLCRLAATANAPTFTHIAYMSNIDPRSSIEAYTRLIGFAGSTGAHMHICHFNSTSLQDVEQASELVRTAQAQGLKVTLEAYPYGVGSTVVGAAFFTDPEFPERTGGGYDTIELLQSGQRLASRDELLAAQERDPGSLILWHFLDVDVTPRHRDLLDVSVLFPGGAIASDAIAWMLDGAPYKGEAWPLPDGVVSHPRSAGTFTRFLSRWVRGRQAMPLIEGLRKCTLIPAEILEACTPQMRRKARIKPGCDADLVVFDYDQLLDMAEFSAMNRPARGMRYVFVNGEAVISNGDLRLNARPGRPVCREPR